MKLTLGQVTDNGSIDQKAGTWRKGKNAVISAQYGAITNEPGFDEIISTLDGVNIGNIVLDTNLVTVFQVNDDNSEVYVVDLQAGTKRLITSNNEFGFSTNHPITGEYYRNSKGQVVIAWTDDNSPPRIMNIEVNYASSLDKLTRVYLKYQLPKLSSYSIADSGGSLRTGANYIATAYISIDSSQTQYSPTLGPFYITDNVRSEIGPKYDGAEPNQATSKLLNLSFTDVDTDYEYLVVALISKIGGVITAKEVKKIKITSSTINTNILGSENEGVVSLEDIVIGADVYDKVKAITQLENQLFMANLSKEEEVAFQLAALNIKINYESTIASISATDDTNPKLKPLRGHMHNEVVALYIHLIKDDGTITKGFHIPGRPRAVYNNADFPEFNGLYEDQLVTVAAGDHITRAVNIGGANSKIFQFFNTADNPSATTNMQFWQNEETYPDNPEFGALANQPVRHHKFPSIGHMKSRHYDSDGEYGKSKLSRLNIKVSNVVLPVGYSGYFISAAKRNLSNSTILAQDMMLYSGRRDKYATTEQRYWTTSGNWSTHQEGDDNIYADPEYIRIHAFDLFIDKPSVFPNYVEAELTIYNRDISVRYDFNTKAGGSILQSGGFYIDRNVSAPEVVTLNGINLNDDYKKQDLLVIDNTKGNVLVNTTTPKKRFSKASGFRYLPNNVQGGLGIFINIIAEECAVLRLENSDIFGFNGLTLKTYDRVNDRRFAQFSRGSGPTGGIGAAGVPEEVTYLYNLKQYRADVYINMFEQDLFILNTEMAVPLDDTSEISVIGGDTIVSDMSFWTFGPSQPGDTNPSKGIRVARRHIVESVNFASFRYQSSDGASYFYPETDPFPFIMYMDKSSQWNKWAYNKDYTSVNDLNALQINSPIENLELTDSFPYRIIRSEIDQAEEKGINNWRTFPVRDYYEMPKHRGEIVNIQGDGDTLIINQKYSLFRTRNKIKLATSEGEVIAGSGDIFAIPPQEILSTKEGYAGCQHKSSCLLTKGGYTFIDAEQGKIFLLSDKLEEISLKGNSVYFFDAVKGVNDNPYTDTGFTIGWDSEFNRIIFSKTNDFTISYSLDIEGGGWVVDHDYHPNSMFHTREGLYSFKDNIIYKHNSRTKFGIYYDETIYPTFIVPVFNDPKQLTKYTFNIKWRSEIRNSSGGIQTKETLTQLFLFNSFQATNLIDLTNYDSVSFAHNLRKTAGVWNFNRFRDLVIDPTKPIHNNYLPITGNLDLNKQFRYKRRFIDHYLLVNFMYDNQPVDGEQRNLYLYEVDVDFKPIER